MKKICTNCKKTEEEINKDERMAWIPSKEIWQCTSCIRITILKRKFPKLKV
jgi:hypothetical protein